jgi:putative cell wall-binding protein
MIGMASPVSVVPAWAADPLVISGTLVDPGGASLDYEKFTVSLWDPETNDFGGSKDFEGSSFSIAAPRPGAYRLQVVSQSATWAVTHSGDTPFRWHAAIIELDGTTPAEPTQVELLRAGSIAGTIEHSLAGLAWDIRVDAYLIDPETGREVWTGGTSRDFAGEYVATRLPPGDYIVRFSHRGPTWSFQPDRLLSPQYFDRAGSLEDAALVVVEAGEVTRGIDAALEPWSFTTDRVAGPDRFATGVTASALAFPGGADVVYLANAYDWPDALSAAPAAAALGGPLLLTRADAVPDDVLREIARLSPDRVVLAGGAAVVSENVRRQVERLGMPVERVAGADRYETSRRIAAHAFDRGTWTVWFASGGGFADALSAAAAASEGEAALLLVPPGSPSPDAPTVDLIDGLGATQFRIAGGPGAVAPGYEEATSELWPDSAIQRHGGIDRYETSRMVSEAAFSYPDLRRGGFFLANGTGFPDALSIAPIAGLTKTPLFLTRATCVEQALLESARRLDTPHATLVGGTGVLSSAVEWLQRC